MTPEYKGVRQGQEWVRQEGSRKKSKEGERREEGEKKKGEGDVEKNKEKGRRKEGKSEQ